MQDNVNMKLTSFEKFEAIVIALAAAGLLCINAFDEELHATREALQDLWADEVPEYDNITPKKARNHENTQT